MTGGERWGSVDIFFQRGLFDRSRRARAAQGGWQALGLVLTLRDGKSRAPLSEPT